jgi:hypothetical protein
MWVLPDTKGIEPGYEQRDVSDLLAGGTLVPVASGKGHEGAVSIHQRDAALWVARLPARAVTSVPDAPHAHVFVAAGQVALAGQHDLGAGDAARLSDAGALELVAGAGGAEVLVWETS